MILVLMALVSGTACTTKENPPVTSSSGSKEDTVAQVRALQAQVRGYGEDFMAALGGAPPNPGTVLIGPAPCEGKVSDLAEDGSYYVGGGWQIPLAADKQISAIRAVRDSWQAKGYKIVAYKEFADGTEARMEGEDPSNGFTFSVISTSPPTAVGIRVLSTCFTPPDGKYPGSSLAIYE